MALRMKTFFPALFLACVVISCPIGHGMAQAFSFHLEVRDSLIDIQAEQVPLIDILKSISEKTGIVLKSGDSLTDAVTFHLKAASVEDCIGRLLAKRNHVLLFKDIENNRSVPIEVQVFGTKALQTISGQGFHASKLPFEADSNAPPPEDPVRRYQRAWFEREFKDENKLSSQISAKSINAPINDMPEARGFRITKLAKNSVLREIGLKEGDIVADVNGQPVGTAEEFIQALRFPPNGHSTVRIELLRTKIPI